MPDDDDIIDRLIQSLNAQPGAADLLVAVLSDRIRASQRSGNLQDASHEAQVRWLVQGVPVVNDTAGVGHDVIGEGYFDTNNLMSGSAAVNATNPRQIDITAGAGSDCLFDYLVSSCFSTLSGFVEGQSFTSLSGCTFKGYSTLSLMQTAVQTAAAPATVAICGGTYAETWTINGTALNGLRVSYFGASSAKVLISALTFTSGGFNDSKGLLIREVQISGTTDLTGADSTWLEDCVFGVVSLPAGQSIRDVHFKSCDIASVTGGSGNQWATCSFENCYVAGNMIFSTGSSTLGPMRIESCQVSGGIDQGSGGTGTDIQLIGNVIGGTVNSGANCIRVTNCSGLVISGNEITASPTGASIQLREQNGRDWGFAITGNRFAANANGYLGTSSGTSEVRQGIFAGNNFATAGGASTKAIHATADFGYVTFGPNGPDCMDYSSVVSDSGVSTNVFYTSCTVPTGATHPMYGTGTSSTGAAANEPFVTIGNTAGLSAERALTGTPSTAGPGGVKITDNGANSTVYLDLGDLTGNYTNAGVFDISTAGNLTVLKHAAVGNTGTIASADVLTLTETMTHPAGGPAALNAGMTYSMDHTDGATGLNGLIFSTNITATAGETVVQSGIVSDIVISANFQIASGASLTVNDYRRFWNRGNLGATAATVVKGYGERIDDWSGSSKVVTTGYGLWIANQAFAGTPWAIVSLGGKSYHQGQLQIGGAAAGSAEVAPNASAILDLTNVANLGLLLPAIATASLPAGVNGLLVYDSTTNTIKGYVNGAYVSLVTAEHHVISAQVDATVASTTVPYQVVGPMPAAGTITGVEAKSGENKTNGATSSIFDVHKILAASADTDGQGTTIFTTQGNRPTITNTHMLSSTTLPDVTTFAAGDYFAVYTDQAGTTLTVANVGVRYTIP